MLSDFELYNLIKKEVDQIIIFDKINEAKESINNINILIEKKGYKQENKEFLKKYEAFIVQLRWITLPILKKSEVLDLFSHYFKEIFKIEDFNLEEKFRSFLLGVITHEERDLIKAEIKSALNKVHSPITFKQLSGNLPPTIENWLKIYTSNLGLDIVDGIKLRQFYIDNKDFNTLSEEEKSRIRILYNFYEKLKFSSLSVAGVEENIPVVTPEFKGYIRKGKLEKDTPMDKRTEEIFKIVSNIIDVFDKKSIKQNYSEDSKQSVHKYQDGSIEERAIKEEIERENKIDELAGMAGRFPVGSLERKAIEEELKKYK